MPKAAGRDQLGPMERVVRILIALTESGEQGLGARRLCQIANLPGNESGLTQLRRDLAQLRRDGGWDIVSSGEQGEAGRYVLHAHDNRLELLLTAGERAALQQASVAVGTDIPDPPTRLAELEHAVERHCLVGFGYKHRPRTVHPHTLHNGPSGWMLRGREVESDTVKEFVVARIAGSVTLDDPGSAEVPEDIPRHDFNPMSWQLDPPETVTVATATAFAEEALQLLTGSQVIERTDDEVIIEVPVTHRAAFRSRMAELGVRVRFVGESANADEMISALRRLAEVGD
jgi:predicted DNA-binding transcriptional regulator YafY